MSGTPVEHTADYVAANKGPTILSVIFTMTAISTMFIGARVFTRAKILGKMQLDDWLVVVSVVSQWTCVALAARAVHFGNGRHFDTLEVPQMEAVILFTMLNFPFGIVAFGIPKLAVVALLVRIMNPSKFHRNFLWVLSIATFVILFGCIPILFGQCTPSESQWNFAITNGKCWSKDVIVYYAISAGALSAFTDLYLAIYPATVLWKLQLNMRKKLALCVALGIGSIATVVAIYKCTRLPSLASADFSWDTSDLVIWTVVEGTVIIVACCIPVLQPLVDLVFGRRALGSSNGYGYKNYGSSRSGRHLRSDIELEKAPKGSARRGTVSHAHSSKHMDTSLGRTEVDSQESILRVEDMKPGQQPVGRASNNIAANQIVRTDVVTVTYDADSTDGRREDDGRWGRI